MANKETIVQVRNGAGEVVSLYDRRSGRTIPAPPGFEPADAATAAAIATINRMPITPALPNFESALTAERLRQMQYITEHIQTHIPTQWIDPAMRDHDLTVW